MIILAWIFTITLRRNLILLAFYTVEERGRFAGHAWQEKGLIYERHW